MIALIYTTLSQEQRPARNFVSAAAAMGTLYSIQNSLLGKMRLPYAGSPSSLGVPQLAIVQVCPLSSWQREIIHFNQDAKICETLCGL